MTEINYGDEVYLAVGYKGITDYGVISHKFGTIYFFNKPPEGVEYVIGHIEPIRRGYTVTFHQYNLNFSMTEINALANKVQGNETISNNSEFYFGNETAMKKILNFETEEEALTAYRKLKENDINCLLVGRTIKDIQNIQKAKSLLNSNTKSHKVYRDKQFKFKDIFRRNSGVQTNGEFHKLRVKDEDNIEL